MDTWRSGELGGHVLFFCSQGEGEKKEKKLKVNSYQSEGPWMIRSRAVNCLVFVDLAQT